jgi:hypothetical protein
VNTPTYIKETTALLVVDPSGRTPAHAPNVLFLRWVHRRADAPLL